MITIPGKAVLPNVCMRSLRDTEEVAINPAGKKKTESKGLWEERGHRQVGLGGWFGTKHWRATSRAWAWRGHLHLVFLSLHVRVVSWSAPLGAAVPALFSGHLILNQSVGTAAKCCPPRGHGGPRVLSSWANETQAALVSGPLEILALYLLPGLLLGGS